MWDGHYALCALRLATPGHSRTPTPASNSHAGGAAPHSMTVQSRTKGLLTPTVASALTVFCCYTTADRQSIHVRCLTRLATVVIEIYQTQVRVEHDMKSSTSVSALLWVAQLDDDTCTPHPSSSYTTFQPQFTTTPWLGGPLESHGKRSANCWAIRNNTSNEST